MAGRPNNGIGRWLAALRFDGVRPNKDGMFILTRGVADRVVEHVEYVCANDDRYDWKWGDEA